MGKELMNYMEPFQIQQLTKHSLHGCDESTLIHKNVIPLEVTRLYSMRHENQLIKVRKGVAASNGNATIGVNASSYFTDETILLPAVIKAAHGLVDLHHGFRMPHRL